MSKTALISALRLLAVSISPAIGTVAADDAGDRLLAQANSAYRSLQSAEAVTLYRRYLADYSDRADVRTWLGASLLNLNQLPAAMDEAGRAIALDAGYAKAYILAGRICSARELWAMAESSFEQAQRIDPRDVDAWYFSGRAAYDANRFENAVEAFGHALMLDASQSRTYQNLALAQDGLGRFGPAEESFRMAVKLARDAWRPNLAYGAFLFRQSRAQESLPFLRRALVLAPASEEVRFELGRVLFHQNAWDEAAKVLEPALISNTCRVHYLMARIRGAQSGAGPAEADTAAMAHCQSDGLRP